MIIAGFTSYTWAPDWKLFAEIAREVGAVLLADISHAAGMATAGAYPNPVGLADVITCTTHKTFCGPRGAIIMTTDEDLGKRIDMAVFPGEQGGPHTQKFAAMAVAFKIAGTDAFKRMMHRIKENAAALADGLTRRGLKLAYGGTDTHFCMFDLNSVKSKTGAPLRGEPAVRILDMAGIVANKNTIPGDTLTALGMGIRLGTPWLTQRGFGPAEIDRVAGLIHKTVTNIQPFSYTGLSGELPRGKIDLDIFEEIKAEVADLAAAGAAESPSRGTGYPHYFALADTTTGYGGHGMVLVSGERATPGLNQIVTADVAGLRVGQAAVGYILDSDGCAMDTVGILRLTADEYCRDPLSPADAAAQSRPGAVVAARTGGWVHAVRPQGRSCQGGRPAGGCRADTERGRRAGRSLSPVTGRRRHSRLGRASSPGAIPLDAGPVRAAQAIFRGAARAGRGPGHRRAAGLPLGRAGRCAAQADGPVRMAQGAHAAYRPLRGLGDACLVHRRTRRAQCRAQGRGPVRRVSHGRVRSNRPARGGVPGPGADQLCPLVRAGESFYSYLLDVDGNVIDDLLIYRRAKDNFQIVVNASNADKDWAWLNAVNNGEVLLDRNRPDLKVLRPATLRNLKDPSCGMDMRVDLALQGPASMRILQSLTDDVRVQDQIGRVPRTGVTHCVLSGFDLVIARTGYTGEDVGYEIFVHPDRAVAFWELLLEAGKPFGIQPTGLAARDSTRTEAGLPLYGHELAGHFNISPAGRALRRVRQAAQAVLHRPRSLPGEGKGSHDGGGPLPHE